MGTISASWLALALTLVVTTTGCTTILGDFTVGEDAGGADSGACECGAGPDSGSPVEAGPDSKSPTDAQAPDFTFTVAPAPVRVVQGSSQPATVTLMRTGSFAGALTVTATGLPTGVSVAPLTIPAASDSGTLIFDSTAGATLGGSAMLGVTGTSGALSHTMMVQLYVQGPHGALDTTFGTAGKSIVASCPGGDGTGRAVVAANGDIVMAGNCNGASGSSGSMVALTSGGVLDTGFAGTGKYVHAFTGGSNTADVFSALVAQSDGKLVPAGFAGVSGQQHFFLLARLTALGVLDAAGFASPSGYDITDFDNTSTMKDAKVYDLALRPDGSLAAVGFYVNAASVYSAAFALYGSDGKLEAQTFNAPTLGYGAVAARADNVSVVVGSSGSNIAIARFDVAGGIDSTFGSSGQTTVALPLSSSANATSVVVLPNNQLLLGGVVQPTAGTFDVFVARFTEAGALDTSFATPNGYASVTTGDATAPAAVLIALQADGKVVLAFTTSGATKDFALKRFNDDGTPDGTFPAVTVNFSAGDDVLTGLALQPDGRIVLGGQVTSASRQSFGVARIWP